MFLPLIRVRANLSSVSYVKQTSAAAETGHGKQTKRAARNHISFSDGYNYLGEKKKYKALILKYVPSVLKYVRPFSGSFTQRRKYSFVYRSVPQASRPRLRPAVEQPARPQLLSGNVSALLQIRQAVFLPRAPFFLSGFPYNECRRNAFRSGIAIKPFKI